MITNICLLLEALSIALCIHYLYGEKFKLDIATVSYLSIYMIIMTVINYYDLPQMYTTIIYPVVVVYCGFKFGFKVKSLIINNILYMAIVSGIQLTVLVVYGHTFGNIKSFENAELLVVNFITFLLILTILPKCKLELISRYLQDKERICFISLIVCIVITVTCILYYKTGNRVELHQSLLLFVSISLICFLIVQLSKYKLKAKEVAIELKMHKVYADSFQGLIDNIRLRQHEFENHINTIYSMHYLFDTYEDLVNAQKEYYNAVDNDNRYYKLLTAGNPVIMAFLYGKFAEIDKLGINISYKISIDDFNVGVPIYKVVEILGNLIKNAAEALQKRKEDKCLFVSMIEKDGIFEIEVRNTSDNIELDEISKFFIKGYSKKGKSRGLGLYNVKIICQEYGLDIKPQVKNIDDKDWLSFVITNKKETR